jgi:hypothetical protein
MARHKHKLDTCPNCDHALEPHYDYCPCCGQENHDIRVPIGHVGYEFVEGFTHFDTKIWNTLKYYFTRPGQMTKEFLEGKRARFVPPPRLYIFVSVIFFIVLSKIGHEVVEEKKGSKSARNPEISFVQDSLAYLLELEDAEKLMCFGQKQADSLLVATKNPLSRDLKGMKSILRDSFVNSSIRKYKIPLPISELCNLGKKYSAKAAKKRNGEVDMGITIDDDEPEFNEDSLEAIGRVLYFDSLYLGKNCEEYLGKDSAVIVGFFGLSFSPREYEQVEKMTDAEVDSMIISKDSSASLWVQRPFLRTQREISEGRYDNYVSKLLKAFSAGMFLFMPLIAFITFIFFRRVRKFYVEHLIFSIHTHTFIFLVLAIYFLLKKHLNADVDYVLAWVLFLGLPLYIIKSIRTVFENTWAKSVFKFFVISFIYTIILCIFVVGSFFLGGLL